MGEGALRLKLAYNFCIYGTGNSRSFLPLRFACGRQKQVVSFKQVSRRDFV
jgi:hypothetical protein